MYLNFYLRTAFLTTDFFAFAFLAIAAVAVIFFERAAGEAFFAVRDPEVVFLPLIIFSKLTFSSPDFSPI